MRCPQKYNSAVCLSPLSGKRGVSERAHKRKKYSVHKLLTSDPIPLTSLHGLHYFNFNPSSSYSPPSQMPFSSRRTPLTAHEPRLNVFLSHPSAVLFKEVVLLLRKKASCSISARCVQLTPFKVNVLAFPSDKCFLRSQ